MKKILLLVSLVFAFNCFSFVPNSPDLNELIQNNFMENGEFSENKINELKEKVDRRRVELSEVFRNYENIYKRETLEKVTKKLSKEDVLVALDIIETYLNRLLVVESMEEKRELAWKILEFDFASKVEGYSLLDSNYITMLRQLLKNHVITKDAAPLGEAYNLKHPKQNRALTQEEIQDYIAQGYDISKFEPMSGSSFWYHRDIPSTDVTAVYQGADTPMYEGIDTHLPREMKGFYKKVKKSQTKPKVHFTTVIDGEEHTFKLKFGAELSSEISAGALASALGFHHDISMFARNFELTLPDNMTFVDFKKEWLEYYKKFDPEDYILEVKKHNDQVTIVFRDGLIEAKPKGLERLGTWGWSANGHRSLREVRGLHMFNMWIANNDVKEAGNNKLVFKRKKDDYEIYQFVHDLGFSFGRFSREKPEDFPWNFVESSSDNHVDFKYYSFQENSGFDHVSYYDAKWMARKIGQLSRAQIAEAIALGNWPEPVQKLLVEKLIARRNQMIEAFNLQDEVGVLEFDRYLTTENAEVENGHLKKIVYEGHSQDYGSEIHSVLQPIYDNMSYLAAQAMVSMTSAFDTLVIDSRELGYDSDILGEISFSVDRQIKRNEMVKGNDDNYIVMDVLKVRFGLGGGFVVRGKVNYYKEYKLLYPAKDLREATFHNKFILNAMLPRTIRKQVLPENYVLIMEDGFEGEGELLVGGTIASVGFSAAKGRMTRTIVSKKLHSYSVYQDVSPYKAIYARLYAEMLIFRVPVWEYSNQTGILNRIRYDVKLKDDASEELDALDAVIQNGSFSLLEKYGQKEVITSDYSIEKTELSLFFVESDYRRRVDDVHSTVFDENRLVSEGEKFQIDILRNNEWSFMSNGEIKTRRFTLNGDVTPDGKMHNVALDMKFFIEDMNATSAEFENAYLKTYDQLAMKEKFLNFTPSLHSHNNVWHGLQTHINLMYTQDALDKLINYPVEEYHELMAKFSNRDAEFWSSLKDNREIDRKSRFIRKKYRAWIKSVEAAKAAKNDKDRYTIIADAFSNIVWLLDDGYQGILLQRLHYILGSKNFYMEALVTQAGDIENTLPMTTPLYNVLNPELKAHFDVLEFEYKKLEEIWELFQKE